jgi:hypothetical protein
MLLTRHARRASFLLPSLAAIACSLAFPALWSAFGGWGDLKTANVAGMAACACASGAFCWRPAARRSIWAPIALACACVWSTPTQPNDQTPAQALAAPLGWSAPPSLR